MPRLCEYSDVRRKNDGSYACAVCLAAMTPQWYAAMASDKSLRELWEQAADEKYVPPQPSHPAEAPDPHLPVA